MSFLFWNAMCVISYASHLVANQNVILDLVTEAWAISPFHADFTRKLPVNWRKEIMCEQALFKNRLPVNLFQQFTGMRSWKMISKLSEWCCVNAGWRLSLLACMSSEHAVIRRLLRANPEPLKFKILWPWANYNILTHLHHTVYFGLKSWCLWAKISCINENVWHKNINKNTDCVYPSMFPNTTQGGTAV